MLEWRIYDDDPLTAAVAVYNTDSIFAGYICAIIYRDENGGLYCRLEGANAEDYCTFEGKNLEKMMKKIENFVDNK